MTNPVARDQHRADEDSAASERAAQDEPATVDPMALLREADGLLSLVAHRYRVGEIPRDVCDDMLRVSGQIRTLANARRGVAAGIKWPRE